MIDLEKFKEAESERNIEKMKTIGAPKLMKKYGINDMGQAYRMFGGHTGAVFGAMIQAQMHAESVGLQIGMKNKDTLEKHLDAVEKTLATYKSMPSQEEWKLMSDKERQVKSLSGQKPLSTTDIANINDMMARKKKLQTILYGSPLPDFSVAPKAPVNLDSLPSKGATASSGPGYKLDMSWANPGNYEMASWKDIMNELKPNWPTVKQGNPTDVVDLLTRGGGL
jgi:hypothetical protein